MDQNLILVAIIISLFTVSMAGIVGSGVPPTKTAKPNTAKATYNSRLPIFGPLEPMSFAEQKKQFDEIVRNKCLTIAEIAREAVKLAEKLETSNSNKEIRMKRAAEKDEINKKTTEGPRDGQHGRHGVSDEKEYV